MRQLTFLLLMSGLVASCNTEPSDAPAKADAPEWTAEVSDVDTTTQQNVEVKTVGAADFAPWRGGQPIPPGSTVRTPATVKAAIALPNEGRLTLNHSTTVELAEAHKLILTSGEAVLEYPPGKQDDVHVLLPQGEAILHGTKVAFVAGEKDSTITITQGLVEVRHDGQSFEGRAGQEIVLRKGAAPLVTQSPDLGRRVGWSQLGETEAAAMLPDVPRGLGKLVGKIPGGESEHRLDLVKHRVNVKIQGNLAYTEITESFKNPVGQTLEGVYRFPLPADARISRLALKVGNKWMEGEFLETTRAEAIWRDVIEKWRDPAMLKWKEGNTFELRIFPIDPHQTREVTIGYVQRLEPSNGGYTYSYPMPHDRQGLIPAKRFEFEASLLGHDPTQSLEVHGYPAFVETAATKDDQAITKVRWSQDDFIARGDLDVRFGRRDVSGLQTFTYAEKGKDPYAVFVVRPDLPAQQEIKPRDFVIVLDRSLSRSGGAFEAQRQLVPRMIREMDPLDRVTVVACNEACEAVGPAKFQPGRVSSADAVHTALLEMKVQGASYPVEAVRVAGELLRRRPDKAREAHVIYFTDGIASVGEQRPGRVADAVQRTLQTFDARMSVVNLGGDSDDLVLDALASGGRGRVVKIDPMLSMTGQALDILNDHYRTVLSRPTLSMPPGVTAELNLPSAIAAGDEIVVAARFNKAVIGELKLTGTVNGKDFALAYPIDLEPSRAQGNKFVPGEWAAQRIDALELDPADHSKEIIKLSKTHGVLSRYTTLLALESNEMMDEYRVGRRSRTQWTGEEDAEESGPAEFASESAADTAAPEAKDASRTRSKRSKGKRSSPKKAMTKPGPSTMGSGSGASAPRAAKPSMDLFLDDSLGLSSGGGGRSFEPTPLPRRSRRHFRPRPTVSINAAAGPTKWERSNARKRQDQLQRDPTNRTKRMRYIRAMIRANNITGALRETKDWLDTNPMDPEARVQRAQLEAMHGDVANFYPMLIESLDAAPRGRWLQERVAAAAKARGDEPLSCAMNVALEGTQKRAPKSPADILACPMTTVVGTWFGEPGPADIPPATDNSSLKGDVTITLKSNGGDWDIMLLEPSGRPIWWGSARRKLKVANVVGSNRSERLALPSLKNGTYSVMLVPRTGKAGDVLEVEIKAKGKTKTVHVNAKQSTPFEVAEIVY